MRRSGLFALMTRIAACAALAAGSTAALANSTVVSGAGAPANATTGASLDFQITIPRILYLQVGTGTPFTGNAAINLLAFAPTAAEAIAGGAVASVQGGDIGAAPGTGAVTVRLFANGSNAANVQLSNSVTGPIGNGIAGQTIPWSAVTVTAAALATTTAGFTNTGITHPPFNTAAGGGASATPTTFAPTAGVVRQEGQWTFGLNLPAGLAAGTYGGVNVNNSRVTYTATMP